MRRADRLFQIVLLLGRGRAVTARALAEKLEVSERTIYRDMADLMTGGLSVGAVFLSSVSALSVFCAFTSSARSHS